MHDSFGRSVLVNTASLLSVHLALSRKQQTLNEPLGKGEVRLGAGRGVRLGDADLGRWIADYDWRAGAPQNRTSWGCGGACTGTNPSRACSRLLSIYSGSALHACVGLRPREESLVFTFSASGCLNNTLLSNIHTYSSIWHKSRVTICKFRGRCDSPAIISVTVIHVCPACQSVRRVEVGFGQSCATSYNRCLPAFLACCAHYQTWSK